MVNAERGIMLNLLPDEEVVYKARAGRLSFWRRLPAPVVVATNKRLFLFNRLLFFSRCSSFYYDKMESVNVKRGLLSSSFVIKMPSGNKSGKEFIFYKKGHALSVFSIVSNQILASRDPHNSDRIKAAVLDTRYAVLNKDFVFAQPMKDRVTHLTGFARRELLIAESFIPDKFHEAELAFEMPVKVIKPEPAKEITSGRQLHANPTEGFVSHITGKSNILSITQRLHKRFASPAKLHPGQVNVGYFAAGREFRPEFLAADVPEEAVALHTPKLSQVFMQTEKNGAAKRMNPDTDMQIFRVRKIRGKNFQVSQVGNNVLNQFNLFNAK